MQGQASARKEKQMKYRIDDENGQHSRVVSNRDELLKQLKKNADAVIDIVKEYKSGVSDSVQEKYEKYLKSPYQSRKLQ